MSNVKPEDIYGGEGLDSPTCCLKRLDCPNYCLKGPGYPCFFGGGGGGGGGEETPQAKDA
jgi:hypothetical protein